MATIKTLIHEYIEEFVSPPDSVHELKDLILQIDTDNLESLIYDCFNFCNNKLKNIPTLTTNITNYTKH